MKLYVSGPMTGYPDFNYPAFEQAATWLRNAGYEVVSPHEVNPADGVDHAWEWYIRRDIVALMECDGIALLAGHEDSRGSALECHVGAAVGMDCLPLAAWLGLTAVRQSA